MSTEEEKVSTAALKPKQNDLVNRVGDMLVGLGIFRAVGAILSDGEAKIAAEPMILFDDMLEDKEERTFAYVAEIPEEDDLVSAEIFEAKSAKIAKSILLNYLRGGRVIVENQNEFFQLPKDDAKKKPAPDPEKVKDE